GPFDPDCPVDLTPCFEDTFLKLIPAIILLIAGIPRLIALSKQETLASSSTNWRQTFKLVGIVALIAISIGIPVQNYMETRHHHRIGLESMASIFETLTLIFALNLTVVESKKNYLSSNVLLVYWLLLFIVSSVKLRTLTMGCPLSIIHLAKPRVIALHAGKVIDAVLIFALECVPREAGIRLDGDNFEKCPEEEANIFSIASFHWVRGLIRKGYMKPLTMGDLWGLRKVDRSKYVSETFAAKWENELKKGRYVNESQFAANPCERFRTPVLHCWKVATDILGFVQPVLLRELLRFIKTDRSQPLYRGYAIAVLMFVCSVLQSVTLHQYYHLCFRCGMHVHTSLITAIYQKSLRLSNSARQSFTVGEIVNHVSVDTQHVQDLLGYLHGTWSGVFQIVIALYLLYDTMSWAIFAGVIVMILTIPLNARLSAYMNNFQQQQMENKDARIRLMNELLNGIRVIKLYAWENTFFQKVMSIRNNQELATMKKVGYLNAVQTFTWVCTPFLVSISTFAVYSLVMNKPMTSDIVFPSIALFNLLQLPLAVFPDVLSSSVQAYVSLCRIQKFLVSDEIDTNAIIIEDRRAPSGQDASDKYTVLATDASYSWNKNSTPVISDINLILKRDELLSIVGRVGSGKSSLIATLCGDLERVSGEIRIRGSVAFVPQQAWIMNDTLRNNILFGNPYDPTFYKRTIDACCLQPDFDMLLGGDMAEIGERGINLSGGQKARISLARAVYARADIYLFDDPLSAVDAHVGRNIFDKVIGPSGLLVGKTRVFVTHQIQYLAQSTLVMMLRDGKVVEQGKFHDLMEKKTEVSQLMAEFGREVNSQLQFSKRNEAEAQVEMNILEEDVGKRNFFPEERFLAPKPRRNIVRSASVRLPRHTSSSLLHGKAAAEAEAAKNNVLMTEERMNQGRVNSSVYKAYAKACSSMYYMGIYAVLGLTYAILTVFQSIILLVHCTIRSAKVLHQEMLSSVLRSPMIFFDTTPMGRILNRFSKDQSTIDEVLPRSFSGYSYTLFQVGSVLVVVTLSTPSLVIVIIPFSIIYLWLQRYYLATSRELRRLDSVTRSPIFANFQETLGGISTVRAYRQQNRFIQGNEHRLDHNLRAFYPSLVSNRWLAIRLESLSSIIIFGAAFLAVASVARNIAVDPGLVGLSLTYALNVTQTLNWMVRQYTEIESNIVSVERLQEYIDLTPEAPGVIENHRPPQEWPADGQVDFVDYQTRYRPGLDLVLRGLNCSIKPHEKIGICGRTGAGKSSLTLSLFRIIEAVLGRIEVDGVDISTIGLYDLRSRLSIIPQDPVLFAGTIRFNLDPLNTKSDQELWQVLEDSNLKEYVSNMEGGLSGMVLEGGDNFSVGQRQLICLARALLRKTSVLILDEATAAIDLETDALVQKIIRQKFNDRTILTIAHRINTVMDSDRIMVLDKGRIVEFDSPKVLLKNRNSIFYSLAKESGNVE
ncbi:hypothetical protein BGZ65_012859, partial [Modicella reniformis]